MSPAHGSGAVEVGLIVADPTPTLLSLVGAMGLDFIVIDAEQTGLTVSDCADAVQRLAGSGTQVGVRVPDTADNTLVAYANTGVGEIVLPQVRSVEELERSVRATRYAPEGARSHQPSFASVFGTDYSLAPAVTVLFETVDAADSVEEFARSPYFSGGWVGPTDLAADLERRGMTSPDALALTTQSIIDSVTAHGHSMGLPCPTPREIGVTHARGASKVALYWEKHLVNVIRELVLARPS